MSYRNFLTISKLSKFFHNLSTESRIIFKNRPESTNRGGPPRHFSNTDKPTGEHEDKAGKTRGKKENQGLGDPERPSYSPEKDEDVIEDELPICCHSGCSNCVWIEYVEKLTKRYLNPDLSREKILKDLESIEDESIKSFIKLELRSKGLLK